MGFDYINKWKKQRRKRKTDLKKLQHGLMNRTKYYGSDIFQKPNFKKTAKFVQHGDVSVRKHSISVALTALRISHMLPFHTNDKQLSEVHFCMIIFCMTGTKIRSGQADFINFMNCMVLPIRVQL